MIEYRYIDSERDMSRGCRCLDRTPLSQVEIEYLINEIRAIEADETVFKFNDQEHIKGSTCYDIEDDIIYVTRNVFPDKKSFLLHPRDQMSERAVLAHEYYGHRNSRDRYLKEERNEIEKMPRWQDEAFASLNAAFYAPSLSDKDRTLLINDAATRYEEEFQPFTFTDEMKEIIYGKYDPKDKRIVPIEEVIALYSHESGSREYDDRESNSPMP